MLIAVAGPYTAADEKQKQKNLDALNHAAAELYRKGHIPVIGVNAALFVADKLPDFNRRNVINQISFALVNKCDAVLMTGSSAGADEEKKIIESKGMPVYYSLNEIPEAHN